MDSSFKFLSSTQADLLGGILIRRRPTLLERIRQDNFVSRADAEEILSVISEELNDNLDEDWEVTDYGRAVNVLLAKVNASRIKEWP